MARILDACSDVEAFKSAEKIVAFVYLGIILLKT
jgi:hypothetical protein